MANIKIISIVAAWDICVIFYSGAGGGAYLLLAVRNDWVSEFSKFIQELIFLSKFDRKKIAITVAFASLFGGKTQAVDTIKNGAKSPQNLGAVGGRFW